MNCPQNPNPGAAGGAPAPHSLTSLGHARRSVMGPTVFAAALVAASSHADSPRGILTSVMPYAVTVSPDYEVQPILSAGDTVPLTGASTRSFQLVGVPDGLGVHRESRDRTILHLNHELAGNLLSEPVIGDPLVRGAFVSRFELNESAEVLSGGLAYETVIDTAANLRLPLARSDNATPAFWRFCSGTLAWRDAGFDRPIYLLGEENPAPNTFDGNGGLAVAIVDHELRTLPHLGHFQHENLPVRPTGGEQTTLVLMEDNGNGFDSQLYLYVGKKNRRAANADALTRNGLVGGRFYVLVPTTAGVLNESQFQSGSINGRWVELTGVEAMNEAQLEAACDAVGAFGMAKAEDGAWSKRNANEFYFNTTGDGLKAPTVVGNHIGRTYRLNLDPRDVTGPCTLTLLYNADVIVAQNGDIALTPDNMDTSRDYLMVCEDGTGYSREVMANKGRQGLIWRYDLRHDFAAEPVVSVVPAGRDGRIAGPGVWETSGIVNTESMYGRDTWLFDVQAHPPTKAPVEGTLEDGQILLLRPVHPCHDED